MSVNVRARNTKGVDAEQQKKFLENSMALNSASDKVYGTNLESTDKVS